MERDLLLVEAVGGFETRARAGEPDLRRHFEEDGEIGNATVMYRLEDALHERQVFEFFPPVRLVGDGGEDKAVADDEFAALEGGRDQLGDQLRARGEEEQYLGGGVDAARLFRENHAPDILAGLHPARIAREDGSARQYLPHPPHLDGFPGALAPFEHDELPAGHPAIVLRSGISAIL